MALRHLLLCLALLFLPALAQAQSFPQLTGRVVDQANLLDPAREQALTAQLAELERQSGRQLVVVTLSSLEDHDIADYGYRLGRAWGIGTEAKKDGAMLIIAPSERKLRIEVGYGLEGILTDAMSALIINNAIVPRFKAGDFSGGIEAGVAEIAALLRLPPDEARARAAEVTAQARQNAEGADVGGAIVVLMFVLFFIVLPMVRRARGGRRYRGGAGLPIILWGPGFGGGDHWGGGGGGGGGWGGGGGFSGGGGSFGGGGASGSW